MLDRHISLVIEEPYPATDEPHGSKVGIEHESPIDQGDAHVDLVARVCKNKSRRTQRCRIIGAESCCAPRQSLGCERLLLMVPHPVMNKSEVTPCGHPIG